MKKTIIIIIFTILLGGCTVNFGETKPEKEVKPEVTEVEKSKVELWPHEEKEFWYAKYFLSMALNPNVQRMLTPRQVFEVVRCTVDGFEKDYTFEKFLAEIGDKQVLPPHVSKYVYDLSYDCSVKTRDRVNKEKKETPIPLEQSI